MGLILHKFYFQNTAEKFLSKFTMHSRKSKGHARDIDLCSQKDIAQ